MLDKLGIKFTAGQKDSDAAAALRGKDSKDVWDNMGKTQQDLLKESAGTMDYAKLQGKLTQSLVDKLGVIMDFLMGEIYDVLIGVWESIENLFNFWPFKSDQEAEHKAQIASAKGTQKKTATDKLQEYVKEGKVTASGAAKMKDATPQQIREFLAKAYDYWANKQPSTTGQAAPSPAQAAAAPPSAKPATPDDMQEATDEQGKNMQGSIDDLRLALKKQSGGIVLNGPYLKNQYGGQIEDSVYNAASRALFEYWMYQQGSRGDAIKALQAGINPRDMGASFAAELKRGGTSEEAFGNLTQAQLDRAGTPHANGGVVARPAPGEVFASVKPGERIVPAGRGGDSTIRLELVGDLKRIIRAEALDAINEAHRAAPRR